MTSDAVVSRRGVLIAVAASLPFVTCGQARAQQLKRHRIGWLDHLDAANHPHAPFVRALGDLGHQEGRDFSLDVRQADWDFSRLPALAAALARSNPDVIVALRDPAIAAVKGATSAIPIVMVSSADPVGLGFVATLGRPGGNVTGVSDIGAELAPKQLDLLKQAVPRLARVTIITNVAPGAKGRGLERTANPARAAGITVDVEAIRDRAGVEQLFAAMRRRRPDGIVVLSERLFDNASINRIAQLGLADRIPLISDDILMTYAGGLMSYGVSYGPQAARAAWYVDRILRGDRPADLPVEEASEFRLGVNVKTAKALRLTIPPAILLRADQVFD